MSLKNILADAAADTGFRTQIGNQRERCISLINDAADEIWKCYDLPNCLGEQLFNLGTNNQQISLPYYVLEPRAVRDYDSELKQQIVDMRPRYGTMGWVHYVGYQWRVKQQEAPLGVALINVEPLTFTLPKPAPETFSVTLEVRTAIESRKNETLVFAVGDTSKTCTSLIEEVYSITKSDYTTYDVSVLDQSGTEVAVIPNSELKTNYTIVNILNKYEQQGLSKVVEFLFKRNLPKFRYETDRFPCGDTYDKAIYYKTMELFYSKQGSQEAMAQALGYFTKCNDLMTKLTENKQEGIKMIMDFGTNRWRRVAEKCYNPRYATGIAGINNF